MNVIRKIMILCLLAGMLMPVWAKDYQMTMFGIKSDGTTMNTRSIQKAIDFISESGGVKHRRDMPVQPDSLLHRLRFAMPEGLPEDHCHD